MLHYHSKIHQEPSRDKVHQEILGLTGGGQPALSTAVLLESEVVAGAGGQGRARAAVATRAGT
jgi:hypothetical protein